jgi:hypothetical protein
MPKIFLTLDTDWCPEEILEHALALFATHELHCTVFATGAYDALKNCDSARLEIGVHPNFNDATPAQYEARLNELLALYPQARGVSSHAMMSSTPLLDLFHRAGLKYDRNLLRYHDAEAEPFQYHNGLWRVPIFWEDDIWFAHQPLAPFAPALLTQRAAPLVFNFHPIHLYLNTASTEHYAAFKPYYHEPRKLLEYRHKGYGVRSFFTDLIAHARTHQIPTGLLKELFDQTA